MDFLHISCKFQKFEKLIVEIILFSVHKEHLTWVNLQKWQYFKCNYEKRDSVIYNKTIGAFFFG